jgi:hypothetical protein
VPARLGHETNTMGNAELDLVYVSVMHDGCEKSS